MPADLSSHYGLPDGRTIPRVNMIDYVAALTVPGAQEGTRFPLFTAWTSPVMRLSFGSNEQQRALFKVSDYSVRPARPFTWVVTAIAASHAEAVVELAIDGRRDDIVVSGPWVKEGVELANPIVISWRTGHAFEGWLDRRRCPSGAVHVWLRGFFHRED